MIEITVIGAGDVFRNRYLPAVAAIGERYNFTIEDVVDIRPPSKIIAEIQHNMLDATICAHQLLDSTPYGLVELLDQENLLGHPVIVATPSPFHVPYAVALLKRNMTVCIEKPFAAHRSQVSEFDKVIGELGTDRLFLLGYYALEKGLAALALAKGGNEHHQVYLDFLSPAIDPRFIAETRASLGRVRQIRAVLLEGSGSAGRLDHRSWILNPSSGGNTIETFYHLVCMALPFLDDYRKVQINSVKLARHRATVQRFYEQSGQEASETLTIAHLSTGSDAEARLICAKYVPESLHERWMDIEFDHGRALVDFENCTLKVEGRDLNLSMELRYKTKYATQLALFAKKIRTPRLRTEYTLFRDALLLTLDIRECGLEHGLHDYDSQDLTRSRLEDWLGHQ
jgi:predicted dehydrogenase